MNATNTAGTLRTQISNAENVLAEWGQKFLDNPAYALEWSNETFIFAARVVVFTQVADALEGLPNNPKNSHEKITAYVRQQVMRGAIFPPGPTSAPSNMLETRKTQAWAEALELLEGDL